MIKRFIYFLLFNLVFQLSLFAQIPVASFSQNQTTGCGLLVVNFSDYSTNSPTFWDWDFGDGTAHATNQNPVHAYFVAGTYSVTLIASNALGSNTIVNNALINVFPEPVCNFSATIVSGCVPLNINFNNIATSGTTGIASYLWDFGDGSSASLKNPSHTYLNAGSYSVSLMVIDSNGCSTNYIKNNYIVVSATPVATFTSTVTEACTPPFNVDYTATTTGVNLNYYWDFGDGLTANVQNVSHTYTSTGNFEVSLTTTNATGCSNTITKTDYIRINTFTSDFTVNANSTCINDTIRFSDNNLSTSLWYWSFGDGATSLLHNPEHTYATAGNYTLTFASVSAAGCVDTVVLNNLITVNSTPTINFIANNTHGCNAPFSVNFTDLTPNAVAWLWNFGDSTTSTFQNPSHTYNASGTYSVTLIVTDNNGCSDTLTKNNYIDISSPIAGFSAFPTSGCKPVSVQFTDNTFSQTTVNSWLWSFGDGTTSNLTNPNHSYQDTGSYTVSLIITDILGCKDTIIKNSFVQVGIVPVFSFTANDTVFCYGDSVHFLSVFSGYTDAFLWNFGDGEIATMPYSVHSYKDTGNFDITLIASFHGCSDSVKISDYITILPPIPRFSSDTSYSCFAPLTVNFKDSSILANTWHWYFGDGETDTLQNPTHTYDSTGLYSVTLIVTNPNGCRDSLVSDKYIRISKMIVGYSQDTTTACQYSGVAFSDTSHVNTSISNWAWSFGDGVQDTLQNPTHYYDSSGVFNVQLIITDILGCKDTVSKLNLMSVHHLPVPHFNTTQTYGCVPLTVEFTDSSSAFFPFVITKWLWNFGDGNTDTIANPTHIYQTRGVYSVSLTVKDSYGCDSTIIVNNLIHATLPYTSFTTDSVICYIDTAIFINTSTGGNLHYQWNFGDGSPLDTNRNPIHKYNVNASLIYNISLTAIDTNGCDSTYFFPILVSHPKAYITSDTTISQCPPFIATFTDSSSSDATTWSWNFGDLLSGANNNSTLQDPNHVYNYAGDYDIALLVTNQYGCRDSILESGFISVNGPYGSFDFSPKGGCAPVTVVFKANAHNTETYQWVFGDGTSAVTVADSVVHIYSSGGMLNPALTMIDTLANSSICSVTIGTPQNPNISFATPNFIVSKDFACDDSVFQFADLSTTTGVINTWFWNFGDGDSSNQKNPQHFYNASGKYDVTLSIKIDSCVYEITKSDYITIYHPPKLKVILSDTMGCDPLLVNFHIVDSTLTDSASFWAWNFADNSAIVQLKNPSHLFNHTATYPITFDVQYDNGCKINYSLPSKIIVNPKPDAQFSMDLMYPYTQEYVHLKDSSSGAIYSWTWNFGDNNFSEDKNPTHYYQFTGDYNIFMKVLTDKGCNDSTYKILHVIERLEIPNAFTPNGDGINDVFMRGYELIILNRWGQELYKGTEGWDGKYKSQKVEPGTYYYLLTIEQIQGEKRVLQGVISLVEN